MHTGWQTGTKEMSRLNDVHCMRQPLCYTLTQLARCGWNQVECITTCKEFFCFLFTHICSPFRFVHCSSGVIHVHALTHSLTRTHSIPRIHCAEKPDAHILSAPSWLLMQNTNGFCSRCEMLVFYLPLIEFFSGRLAGRKGEREQLINQYGRQR